MTLEETLISAPSIPVEPDAAKSEAGVAKLVVVAASFRMLDAELLIKGTRLSQRGQQGWNPAPLWLARAQSHRLVVDEEEHLVTPEWASQVRAQAVADEASKGVRISHRPLLP